MNPTPTATLSRRLAGAGVAATLVLALAACGDDDTDTTGDDSSDETAELRVTDAWARSSAQGQTRGAAYMTIHSGDEDDRLTGASVPETVASATEIHETVPTDETASDDDMDGGETGDDEADDMGDGDMETMTMQEVEALDIPAGDSVPFEPGGYHVMLLDLAEPLQSGDEIEIELDFEIAGTHTVTADVRDG
jgi:copper(I)-binding protein